MNYFEHITLKESVHESLDNAIKNGDEQFLHSLETRNIKAIVEDMCDCDAAVEQWMDQATDYDEALQEVTDAVTSWVNKDQGVLL